MLALYLLFSDHPFLAPGWARRTLFGSLVILVVLLTLSLQRDGAGLGHTTAQALRTRAG